MSELSREERTGKVAGGKASASERSSTLDHTEKGFSAVERWLSYLGLLCLIGLMGMVVFEVVARYAFKKPFQGYIDIMEMMMAVLVFLTLAYCQREDGHIKMEIFMTRVLKGGRRYYATESFHLLVSLIGFAIIAFFTADQVLCAYNIRDVSMTIHLVTWPARALVAIGAIYLCLRFIMQLVQSLTKVIVGVRRPEP